MNKYLVLLMALALVSCKSKQVVIEKPKEVIAPVEISLIDKYYNNKIDFSTVSIKSNVQYSNEAQTLNVTAEIKIKKDEQILISIRFLGITMAKALITPAGVSYYEKMGSSYFEGDFSSLSQWLGTDLDFNKIQNVLLGRAIDDLQKGNYKQSLADQTYKLEDALEKDTKKTFYLDADKFFLKKQEIVQPLAQRMVEINYNNSVSYKEAILPSAVLISTLQKNAKTEINLEYNTITFNEELSFPYSVPEGYKRIIIK